MSSERENQPEEDPSVAARLHRLADHYSTTGVRRGVEAVMVVMVRLFSLILLFLNPSFMAMNVHPNTFTPKHLHTPSGDHSPSC